MRIDFVDTNVLVYAHDLSAGWKRSVARDLVARLTVEQNGAMSIQVLAEFYSVVTRKDYLSPEDAEGAVADFGAWTIHCPSHKDLIRTSRLHRRYGVSWWDALLINSAMELECDTLWSEDFSHGQRFGALTVRNPFAEAASA